MNFAALSRTWITAEIGVNHEGDPQTAQRLVALAAEAGADAVKFQTYQAERYVSVEQPDRLERVRRFALSRQAFRDLAALAGERGVAFYSTPLDMADVDFLDEFVPVFKISSGDLTHLRLIRHVAQTGKPVILSTGLGTAREVREAVETVLSVRPDAADKGAFLLMHCVASYPTPPAEADLANIGWLKREFGLPVGYSDHTLGIKACELAVAAGAVALEKHFTYRKEDQAFHDHHISANPEDLRRLVAAAREAELYLGSPVRRLGEASAKMLPLMRRSLAAAEDIPAGEPVGASRLTFLRPAWGLGPERFEEVAAGRLRRSKKAGELIREEDLEPGAPR